jgi:hypothetical protein
MMEQAAETTKLGPFDSSWYMDLSGTKEEEEDPEKGWEVGR